MVDMTGRLIVLSAVIALASSSVWAGSGCCPGDVKKDAGAVEKGGKAACDVKEKAAEAGKACDKACATGEKAECAKAGHHAATAGIDTASLAALIEAKTPVTILDARSGKYDDGKRVPGAKALSPKAEQAEIEKALPDKKARIVTYCAGTTCPASGQLAERLKSLGYVDVAEYHEGIAGWVKAGKPVENAK